MDEGALLRRLRWRCRRGMRELDELLERYLREDYPGSAPAERDAFAAMLELPDPVIADYLLGGAIPADPAVAALTLRLAGRRG